MPAITIYDYILIPFYLFIFYVIAARMSQFYSKELKVYFWASWSAHLLGSVLFALLIYYYYGMGDSLEYYMGGEMLNDLFQKDITNFRYLFSSSEHIQSVAEASNYGNMIPVNIGAEANLTVMKISSILSFFSFHKYLIISLFFGFFSFAGNWKIYQIFDHINKGQQSKLVAIATLFIPSVCFWGSGLGKESICIFCIGILLYLVYTSISKKLYSTFNIITVILLLYILTIVKSYITGILILSLVIVAFFMLFRYIKNKLHRYALLLISLTLLIYLGSRSSITSFFEDAVTQSLLQVEIFQYSYQAYAEQNNTETTFSSNLDLSPEGILLNSPAVISTSLFRPFIWESRKAIMIFSSLESLITLLSTIFILWKTKLWGFISYTFSNPIPFFCFTFSILFALVVGYTTFNFGTLVRYRIIFLPFYYYLLILNYTHYLNKRNSFSLS